MSARTPALRPAKTVDMDSINRVIRSAVEQWPLPERVKRLALPSYCYREDDFSHLEFELAESAETGTVIAVTALEPLAKMSETGSGMLLHGIYVAPGYQRQGIGRLLIERAVQLLARRGLEGLLVKAQAEASPFFERLGMRRIPVRDQLRDYPYRYWLPIADV